MLPKAKRTSGRREERYHLGPASNEDITIVLGVNDDKYEAAKHT